MSTTVYTTPRICGACGEATSSEAALMDHREWCQGDAAANQQLQNEVIAAEGSLHHDDLVRHAGAWKRLAPRLPSD